MLNVKMIMTGLGQTLYDGKLKELDREDTQRRPDGIVLSMTWKVLACPKRMCSLGLNGEGELKRQPADPGSQEKLLLKWSV